jgi:hypothetical protein
MSVAATLAALDEEIGEILFTVGERADGVVKTGTERMAPFSTRQFFLERDLRLAEGLFTAGAFFAAAKVLKPYSESEALQAREKALCLHEWQRLSYAKAASHAARFSQEVCTHLRELAKADAFSVSILGDLLAGADELLRWDDAEEALARYYRGVEQTAKVVLATAHGVRPPYQLDDLLQSLPGGCRLADEFRRSRHRNGEILLTNQKAWEVLAAIRDPIAEAYFADEPLQRGLQRRNESLYGHGSEPVDAGQVQCVADRLRNLLRSHLPGALASWTTVRRPRSL